MDLGTETGVVFFGRGGAFGYGELVLEVVGDLSLEGLGLGGGLEG